MTPSFGELTVDMIDKLKDLAGRVGRVRSRCVTEEGTKTALVMPFIQALGYDPFDPAQVVPEFTADVGLKKGEKVDYAILRDDKPIILFECKALGDRLDEDRSAQLHRYFHVTEARFAILTDGVVYKIFTDLDKENVMDARPFLEFNLTSIDSATAGEVKKFTRELFDESNIISSASTLKYVKGIKQILDAEWSEPSEEFVKHLTSQVYQGRFTQGIRDQFTPLIKQALAEFLSERINQRLQSAISGTSSPSIAPSPPPPSPEVDEPQLGIVTTKDEIEAYHMIKAIVQPVIDPDRVVMRDSASYCAILIDDNNRKPLCRLWLEGRQWYVGIFDEGKNVTRVSIGATKELFNLSDQLKATAARYVEQAGSAKDADQPGDNLHT